MDEIGSAFGSLLDAKTLESSGRLVVALLLGLCIGLDRELRQKPAGLRSHMMVSLAAAAFTIMTFSMVELSTAFGENIQADPTRLMEAVVTGIAFIGAGAVIQARGAVFGITTGTSLWLAGALGVACGLGEFALAVVTTALGLVVLWLLGWAESRFLSANDSAAGEPGE